MRLENGTENNRGLSTTSSVAEAKIGYRAARPTGSLGHLTALGSNSQFTTESLLVKEQILNRQVFYPASRAWLYLVELI
jgi:hypothetical protein